MKSPPDRRQLVRVVAVVALAAAFIALAVASFGQPLGFDETYNLQIVGHLLHDHRYATDGVLLLPDDPREFDYRITTGPTLMLPVTAAAALLGEHVWVYRLVPLGFFVLLLVTWYRIGRNLGGFWVGVAGSAAVLALDSAGATWGTSAVLGPGDVLGEVAAAALVTLACLRAERPARAGLLVGLAVLTKTVALLTLPAVGLAVLWAARRRADVVTAAVRFSLGVLAPVLAWQAVRLAVLGPDAARDRNSAFLVFVQHGGSGLAGSSHGTPLGRLGDQAELLSVPPVVAVIGLVLVALTVVLATRGPGLVRADDAARPLSWTPVAGLVLAGLTIELWWVTMAQAPWVRHSLIGVYLFFPGLVVAVATYVSARAPARRARPVAGLLAAGLTAAMAAHVVGNVSLPGPTLADQRRVAHRLSQLPDGYHYAGRNQLTDLMLLGAGTPRPMDESGGLLVIRHDDITVNLDFEAQVAACGEVVFDEGGFVGCLVPPGPIPAVLQGPNSPDADARS